MADLVGKPVSSATGSFAALRPQQQSDVQTGNRSLNTGNSLPVTDDPAPDPQRLAHALNMASQSIGRDLHFEVDMESGSAVIQVLDRDTGEVIRQVPPDKANLYLSGNGVVQLRLYNDLV